MHIVYPGSQAFMRVAEVLQGRLPRRAQASRCAAGRGLAWGHAPGQTPGPVQKQTHRRDDRLSRAHQGQPPGQGRASVPRNQAPVRLREGSLPRAEEEHGAPHDAVRTVQPVDGARQVDRARSISASAARVDGCKRAREEIRLYTRRLLPISPRLDGYEQDIVFAIVPSRSR